MDNTRNMRKCPPQPLSDPFVCTHQSGMRDRSISSFSKFEKAWMKSRQSRSYQKLSKSHTNISIKHFTVTKTQTMFSARPLGSNFSNNNFGGGNFGGNFNDGSNFGSNFGSGGNSFGNQGNMGGFGGQGNQSSGGFNNQQQQQQGNQQLNTPKLIGI